MYVCAGASFMTRVDVHAVIRAAISRVRTDVTRKDPGIIFKAEIKYYRPIIKSQESINYLSMFNYPIL